MSGPLALFFGYFLGTQLSGWALYAVFLFKDAQPKEELVHRDKYGNVI